MVDGNWRALAFTFAILNLNGSIAGDLPETRARHFCFSAQRLAYIDDFYDHEVKNGNLAGIVTLIAQHGEIRHLSAVGYSDIDKKQKMEADTIFRLYSMTKPIASTALMMLYEEGRFQLDDPVSKYIPEFANLRVLQKPDSALNDTVPLERPPTIRDLLRHTAGFTHGGGRSAVDVEYMKADIFGIDVSLKEMVEKLATIPLVYQPGTRFAYSIGPDVQARLVEILSSMSFDEFLAKRLFKPLGMKDTGFWVTAGESNRLATVYWDKDGMLTPLDTAHGYPDERHRFLTHPMSVNSYTVNHRRKGGSYGLVATAEDYWRFAQMIANGGEFAGRRILSPHVVRYMMRDHMSSIDAGELKSLGIRLGLGFGIVKDPTATGYISSEGTIVGSGSAATYFWIDPQEEMVVVSMTQHMVPLKFKLLEAQLRSLVYGALVECKQ